MSPLAPHEVALLSPSQRIEIAAKALGEIGEAADTMNPAALADEIDRLSGVGFEAATLVVLSSGR